MTRKPKNRIFLKELQNLVRALRKMKPNETHILNINANFGRYQLVIGPQKNGGEEDEHSIEINGEIDHLFVTPEGVRTHPSKDQVRDNMKDTVIMRGLEVHLRDPMGDGEHLTSSTNGDNGLRPRQCINLAGNKGDDIIERMRHSDETSLVTYRIVQEDILKALRQNRRKSIERVS